MNKRFVLTFAALFFLFSGAFAGQFEVFGAIPIAVSDEYGETPESMNAGLGIGFTSLDKGKVFGIMVNAIVDYHLLDIGSITFPEGMSPVGLDLLLGCTVVPLNTKYVTLPISVGFHTRSAFLDGAAEFDLGIGGTVGVNFWMKKVGIFVRGLFYLDLTRIRLTYEGFSFENTAKLSSFGITPQIGVTIPLGKKLAAPK